MTSTTPGRDALDAALERRYPGMAAQHVTFAPATAGGLHGCSAFADGGYWHVVTYGLSELGAKSEDDDPDWSGWGFELTMRVPGGELPRQAFTVLSRVAEHVNGRGVLLEDGDEVTIDSGRVRISRDPLLGEIRTPNGRVVFLRVEQ
ncbi:suppressor of fused domain protein [Actinoplanes sp. GCM10030250]|uniref:suppressor of fused domain protein n=1 Tax=Actinoplanes sp. GCM10030250 TaxID=3273376 RepID=UPI00361B128A